MLSLISFTKEGLEKVKEEKRLLLLKRPQAVDELRIAREMGDLSENAAYHVARAKLSQTDSRLRHLDNLIRRAHIHNPPIQGTVGLGSKVKLQNRDKAFEYQIVGSFEADPAQGKISHISPLGRLLMGKKIGDEVSVKTSSSLNPYKILNIS
ncbi:hypothetical protein A3D03_05375 [Candidatus Gottesmanbacteria bacterium RIFCSPHIGHO2_02_FULL_40_13]|uniref:Transcription elongation factor GreA n=1 Tax=Candidatus Gottesmanbacteria bacterium RIFCSPHIGHO2_02_FULL_40_13 TaxID=1798384 RepID=A0A1F6A7I2_9BACT|nr:MAG: hypothetical protein A3D03_05375 [Candidatus Gottesmanbacteria bacterium RIFCSPHIGHO2_02_FULL_40_13]